MKSSNKNVAGIGTGYWGKNLVRNFHSLGALHTIYDAKPNFVQQFRTQYGDIQCASSFSEVLGNPEIQGVVISTPAETHAILAHEALLAGKDVYVEKPICLLEQEGVELARLASEKDRILMVGHLLWYHPHVLKLKDLINKGELGRIQYIYSNRVNMGKLRREENVLWSFAPHDISVILGLLDEMPNSIFAQGGNYLHQQIADTTVTLFEFASGVRAHIFVSWLHPFKEQMLVVVGDKKMAVFNDTIPWEEKLQLFSHSVTWKNKIPIANKATAEMVSIPQDEPLRAECVHFLDCLKTRERPRTDGEEGLRVLKVLNACQEALEKNRPVTLEARPLKSPDYFVHQTTIVEEGVEIGAGTKIWHFSHLLSGTEIGKRCNIGQNVVIGPDVTIGSGCKIQNNVSVFKGVTLEDDVFCGPAMVFTNVYNPRSGIRKMDQLRKTHVHKGATIGANATIICGNTLGPYCFIGAGAVVTRDVPGHALMVGNPAKQVGWVCTCGERLPESLECRECGSCFQKNENDLEPLSEMIGHEKENRI
jgi:UDP-2-acetamido-3-amino-2,3-dideoxy-glucuronate N-acetyltransferase